MKILLLAAAAYLLFADKNQTGGTTCLAPNGAPYNVPVGPCPDYVTNIPTGLGRITWDGTGAWGEAGRI